jgi:hypothetical protein
VLVLVLVLAIGLPLAVAGVTLFAVLRKKVHRMQERLAAELQAEPAQRGPEHAVYRGSTGAYPKVLGNGVIALTSHRLIFRKVVGVGIDVRLSDVTGVTTRKVFNGGVVGGRMHLVVQTPTGDVGYFVGDTDAWVKAITTAVSAGPGGVTFAG